MMDQGRGRMHRGNDNEGMSKDLMHLLHIVGEGAIPGPGRCNLRHSKDRQRVTARKLQDDPSDGHGEEEGVQEIVREPGGRILPFSHPCGEF